MHNIDLPRHRYVNVLSSFVLRDHERGATLLPAIWFGCSVTAGRSLGCHVLLECGAMVVDLPLHALRGPAAVTWEPLELSDLVSWDCYGNHAEAYEPACISGLSCRTLSANHQDILSTGTLWFAIDHMGDGYSLTAEEHKHLWVVEREDDALLLLPQDRILIEEKSFTKTAGTVPPIKRQTVIWSAE